MAQLCGTTTTGQSARRPHVSPTLADALCIIPSVPCLPTTSIVAPRAASISRAAGSPAATDDSHGESGRHLSAFEMSSRASCFLRRTTDPLLP